jgi:hypothetical protein
MSEKYNPNITSCAEKKYIIKNFSGKYLLKYSKKTGIKISITNNLYQSLRNTPFVELLYKIGSSENDYHCYNSALHLFH